MLEGIHSPAQVTYWLISGREFRLMAVSSEFKRLSVRRFA